MYFSTVHYWLHVNGRVFCRLVWFCWPAWRTGPAWRQRWPWFTWSSRTPRYVLLFSMVKWCKSSSQQGPTCYLKYFSSMVHLLNFGHTNVHYVWRILSTLQKSLEVITGNCVREKWPHEQYIYRITFVLQSFSNLFSVSVFIFVL